MLILCSLREVRCRAGQGRIKVAEVGGDEVGGDGAPCKAFVLFSHSEQVYNLQASRALPYPWRMAVLGRLFNFFFFIVNLTQARAIWEGGTSVEKMPPSDWSVGKTVGLFS